MNDNKTWKVTIQLTVVATEDPIDDNFFYDNMYGLVSDDYDMCSTVEGVILMGAEAVELTARSSDSKTETATETVVEPTVLVAAPPNESPIHRGKGKRAWRIRTGTGLPFGLQEFVYYSSDYRKAAKKLELGTHTTKNNRECVWLTEDESVQVYTQVMQDRARRAAHRAAAGGE